MQHIPLQLVFLPNTGALFVLYSGASGTRVADNGNGDDCVVISDSEDEPEEEASEEAREAEGDHSKEGQEDEGGEEDDEEEAEEEEDEEQEEGTRPGAGQRHTFFCFS